MIIFSLFQMWPLNTGLTVYWISLLLGRRNYLFLLLQVQYMFPLSMILVWHLVNVPTLWYCFSHCTVTCRNVQDYNIVCLVICWSWQFTHMVNVLAWPYHSSNKGSLGTWCTSLTFLFFIEVPGSVVVLERHMLSKFGWMLSIVTSTH
jgi:hypothetical protein